MKILVLNSGSSSQKASLYEIERDVRQNPPAATWEGKIEWNQGDAQSRVRTSQGANLQKRVKVTSRAEVVEDLLETLWSGEARVISSPSEINAAGHRVVHGGQQFRRLTLITPQVKAAIAGMSASAPLHNRAELEGIDTLEKKLGAIPQVAVFDTSFHSQLPDPAAVYPGPYEWVSRGIRRYGFHGINHQYCAERTSQLLGRDLHSLKLVTCHLGNGCSLAAVHGGVSVDTTMGFTPLDGLMMGTRSGAVDPGALLWIQRHHGVGAADMEDALDRHSGLLGVSGRSSDMREVIAAARAGDERAALAV